MQSGQSTSSHPGTPRRSWHPLAWRVKFAVLGLLTGSLAIGFAAPAAAKKDVCYAFPKPRYTRQIRNYEFKVSAFSWHADATADQSDSSGNSSHATVDSGNGGSPLVGYHRGGYNESRYTPTNAGGYTHLPNACQFHNTSGFDNGMFEVSSHVPFGLSGTWANPDRSGTCSDYDALFNPYIQGGFSRYGSTVKIRITYQAFPIGGLGGSGPGVDFPQDDTQCNPPDPILDFPDLGTATVSVSEASLIHHKRTSIFIKFTGPLVNRSSDHTRTGQAHVNGLVVLQRVGPARCANHVRCGAARFRS